MLLGPALALGHHFSGQKQGQRITGFDVLLYGLAGKSPENGTLAKRKRLLPPSDRDAAPLYGASVPVLAEDTVSDCVSSVSWFRFAPLVAGGERSADITPTNA